MNIKRLLFFITLFSCCNGFAQLRETILADTAVVEILISQDDTSLFIKPAYKTGEWLVYYDLAHSKKALQVRYFDSPYRYISTAWYRNGQIHFQQFEHYYITSLHYNHWYPDGKIEASSQCAGDSCVLLKYYPSGQLASRDVAKGDSTSSYMVWCYTAEYYENGQIKATPFLPNSHERQQLKTFYPSGKIKTQNDWLITGGIGPFKEWYENGQLKTEGELIGNSQKNGIRSGKWTYYSESGKRIKEEFYENDQLVNTIIY